MNTNTAVAKVAEGHTQTSLDPRRPVRALVGEARALHELERAGESGWTPFVAILGLVLFFIIFLFIASLAEAAYYLFP